MRKIFLINPRGFCAGVDRAIEIVEGALVKYGSPIYVNHEIVHNDYVVKELEKKGAIFVKKLSDIPNGSVLIFSAHGVSKSDEQEARNRNFKVIDATCPLVKKIHRFVEEYDQPNSEIVIVGHRNHVEVKGTSGRSKNSLVTIIDNLDEANKFIATYPDKLTYVTQTTLSMLDTKEIIDIIIEKYPNIQKQKSDICYATTNRQEAVLSIIKEIDLLIVVGCENSSNASRLRDLGLENSKKSYLINSIEDLLKINLDDVIKNDYKIALTAGASTPEILISQMVDYFIEKFSFQIEDYNFRNEDIIFHAPSSVRFNEENIHLRHKW
jgi:4-hydroxy-3-methylbut-2-enyl diphosphate reductase